MIAFRVPRASCRGSALSVSIAPRQLHVACARTAEVWLHGELEQPISPSSSTWHTDGTVVTLTLTKLNLQLHAGASGGGGGRGGGGGGGGARGAVQAREQTTHWERLFTSDQYVERGMANPNPNPNPNPPLTATLSLSLSLSLARCCVRAAGSMERAASSHWWHTGAS